MNRIHDGDRIGVLAVEVVVDEVQLIRLGGRLPRSRHEEVHRHRLRARSMRMTILDRQNLLFELAERLEDVLVLVVRREHVPLIVRLGKLLVRKIQAVLLLRVGGKFMVKVPIYPNFPGSAKISARPL